MQQKLFVISLKITFFEFALKHFGFSQIYFQCTDYLPEFRLFLENKGIRAAVRAFFVEILSMGFAEQFLTFCTANWLLT